MDTRKFVVSSAITYVGSGLSVLLTALFYVLAMRMGQESFGALQSSLSFLFLIYTGKSIAGSYIVIYSGGDPRLLPDLIRPTARLALAIGTATAVIFVLLAPVLRDFLHMPSYVPFMIMGVSAIPGILAGTADGILNVQRRFGFLAFTSLLVPLGNVLMAVLLLHNGLDQNDAGWIVLGSQLLHCLNVIFVDWSFLRSPVAQPNKRFNSLAQIIPLLVTSLFLGACTRLDVSWARHLLSSELAGAYAVSASIATVLHLVSSSIGRISSVSLQGSSSTRIIALSYVIIVGISAAMGIGFALLGEPVLNLLVGRQVFIDWGSLLPLFIAAPCFTIIMLDFSCLNVLTKHVHVGISATLVSTQAAALIFFGTSTATIAWAQAGVMAALMLVVTVLLYRTTTMNAVLPAPSGAEPHLGPNA